MADKTIVKRIDEMQVGDVIVKNRVIEAENNTFKIDVKNKTMHEVIKPYSNSKIVLKDLETEEIDEYYYYAWLQYDVLVPKKQKKK